MNTHLSGRYCQVRRRYAMWQVRRFINTISFLIKKKVLLVFSLSMCYICGMGGKKHTLDLFRFDIKEICQKSIERSNRKVVLGRLDESFISYAFAGSVGFCKCRVCCATGMSYDEINSFLEKHRFNSTGKAIPYEAIPVLEQWYIKKLKRYLRNSLLVNLTPEDNATFLEFCHTYRKQGAKIVTSWKDIDEERILKQFRDDCEGVSHISTSTESGSKLLFARILKSCLFHTRCRAARHSNSEHPVLVLIRSHHYHIFITEDAAESDMTYITAIRQFFIGLIRLGMRVCMGLPPRQNRVVICQTMK